jgi:two-component system, cell cycle response regulator
LRAGIRILTLQSELLNAQKMLEFRATHDVLTGIWNRRAVLDRLSQELARVAREMTSSGVIMADIDHFKQVNDRYGHLAGDEVLQVVAQRMKATLRPYDFLGRYGGEEFLIVVPDCDAKKTYEAAERTARDRRDADHVVFFSDDTHHPESRSRRMPRG